MSLNDLDTRKAKLSAAQRAALEHRLRGAGRAPAGASLSIPQCDRMDRIPLSYAQRSLWLTWKLDPASPAYNMVGSLSLKGALDAQALGDALQALAARHEILRTVYPVGEDGEPFQSIRQAAEVPIRHVDVSGFAQDGVKAEARRLLGLFAEEPFSLETDVPCRSALYRLSGDEHVLALSLHHIAGDGWSIGILIEELFGLYGAFKAKRPPQLAPMPIQFADYAVWQRNWFDAGERDRQIAYWRARLGSEHRPIELPLLQPRGSAVDAREERHVFQLSRELSDRVRELGRSRGASLFMVMLSLLKLTLYRFSGDHDVRVGTPVANRQKAETHGLIGYFLNLLVLRTEMDPARSFAELLTQVRETVLEAQAHQDLPFDLLVEALQPERMAGVHPLFQVKCTQQENVSSSRVLADLEVGVEAVSNGQSHFDLALDFTDRDDGIRCVLIYADALFGDAIVRAIATTLEDLAEQVVHFPDRRIAELALAVRPSDVAGPSREFGGNDVLRMWAQAARRHAPGVAVRDEKRSLSYAELDRQSDWLAQVLIGRGVGCDLRVGVYAERSCQFVVGLLAVLKAGGAYVPLDPSLPAARLAYQVRDSGAVLLLCSEAPAWDPGVPVLPIDPSGVPEAVSSLPVLPAHPAQSAYLIYTSGSTGQPKGVVVSHGALANYVQAVLERLDLPEGAQSMAMVSTVAADLGHTVLFGALCSGRALHLISAERAFDPDAFAEYMSRHRVDVLKIVPSHLQALLNAGRPEDVLPACRLVLGGEATRWPLLERIAALKPGCRVLNHYGPTETTVGVLTQEAGEALRTAGSLPVGKPLANGRACVLDADLNLVPAGVSGELYLSGAGVARGYQARAAQTAERFVASPIEAGERLYRTGDRVRMLDDGSLEFLGRVDDQVKVRGYRVELREVAQALQGLPGITEAEVVARDDEGGRTQLHGYVVPQAGGPIDVNAMREALGGSLPEYMVPATITRLDALPLTANGKVDRKALPEPAEREAQHFEAPQGEVEQALAEIWAQVLRVDQVGRHDNFFELGGDSILTLQIIARARKRGLRFTPKQLMERQTVAAVAAVASLDAGPTAGVPALAPSPDAAAGFAPIPVQAWFFEQAFADSHHWNQSLLLSATEAVDPGRVQQAVEALVAHHEALRLSFERGADGRWSLVGQAPGQPVFERIDLSAEGDSAAAVTRAADRAQRSLSLRQPFKAVWMDLGTGRASRLLLVAHHLVVDGVSWRVILEDLQTVYRQLCQGRPSELPAATTGFRDWSAVLGRHAQSDGLRAELPYWQGVAGHAEPPLPGHAAGRNTVADAHTIATALDEARTEQLLGDVPQAYRTRIHEILLTALARTLCAWDGRESVLVELEGHGREDHLLDGVDLSRSVGWFTSLYPVRLAPGGGHGDEGASIKAIKERLRQVPHKGLGYGVLRYLAAEGRVLADGAYPQVTFNYLGQLDQSFDADSVWRLARESAGLERAPGSRRRTWLSVDADVFRGELRVRWTYSAAVHDEATVQGLAGRFLNELAGLIDHCLGRGAGGLSPADIPLARLTQAQIDQLKLDHQRVEHVYPLAPMQQGLLLHTLLTPHSGMYLMQDQYSVSGELDVAAFTDAWDDLVVRHEALRTGFLWHGEEMQLQVVYRQAPSVVEYLDWRSMSEVDVHNRLAELLRRELSDGFDLSRPPLLRVRLVHLAAGRFHLVQSFHHILMDAWCRSLLWGDFFAYYEARRRGTSVDRPAPRPYRDFIAWLQRQDRQAAREFWRSQLQGFDTVTPLPYRASRSERPAASVMSDVLEVLTAEQTSALQAYAQAHQLTINTVVQGAWGLLLARLGGVREVLFGVTVAGRPLDLDGIQDTVGLFINTIPLRMALPPDGTPVVDWLRTLLIHNLAMRQHEHLPLVEIQSLSQMPKGRNLFDSLFVFENAPVDEGVYEWADRLGVVAARHRTHTNYPLTVMVVPGEKLQLQFTFDKQEFDEEGLRCVLAGFRELLVDCVARPGAVVGELRVLPAAERASMLEYSQGAAVPDFFEQSYVQCFAAQVRRNPERPAARCRGEVISYAALDRAAARVAHGLRGQGVRPDDVVALCVDRGLDWLTLVVGVLKAGAAFLSLDGQLPARRLATMLEPRAVRCVAVSERHEALIRAAQHGAAHPRPVVRVEALSREDAEARVADHAPDLDQAAYVIYTSGSTGEPKGVVVTHRGMLNNQLSKVEYLKLGSDDVIAQTASQSFDISVWQLLAGLLAGACIEIVPDEVARDPGALLEHAGTAGVTVLQSVPTVIEAMLAMPALSLPGLRWMLPTGEASTAEMGRRWFERYPAIPLVNAYGPAECADDVSLHRLDGAGQDLAGHYLPIGRPTENTRLYVLDGRLEPMPVGMLGELYVSGVGVGRGYLDRPSLTAERFVPDPYSSRPGDRLYRTGDIARYRPDGVLECMGRADHQVKIRGYRIELGEIEAQIGKHEEVRAAVAAVRHGALVGYLVLRRSDDAALQSGVREQLQAQLREVLPEYMVPGVWVFLERLPTTANGKVDRNALPAPDFASMQSEYEPPQGELELAVAEVWAEMLGVQRVGRLDSFFELGGHSLLAIQVVARLRARLGRDVPLTTLFNAPTLHAFAQGIDTAGRHANERELQAFDAFMNSLEEQV